MAKYDGRTHSFFDLDSTWLEYLSKTPAERRQMAKELLEVETAVTFVAFGILAVLLVVALVKGWI